MGNCGDVQVIVPQPIWKQQKKTLKYGGEQRA